jgi:anti-sigma factor RsiW
MKNFHDIEQLSSYLDGQLSSSESKRLESRLASDPELASAFNDIRAARGILRKLPARKAPRNFTLTRQMVGLKPPLPRSYSFFRFSTAFATVLLVLTFAANSILSNISFGAGAPLSAPAAQQEVYAPAGIGGGPAATEAPAAAAAPVAAATETPAATEAPLAEAPSLNATAQPTAKFSADTAATELPTAKEAVTSSVPLDQTRVSEEREAPVPVAWQIALLVLGLVSGVMMLVLNRSAKQKWQ